MITRLPYFYRDASNYKVSSEIFLDGVLSKKMILDIKPKLEGGDSFIAFDLGLGLDEIQDRLASFPSDDDHVYHSINFHEMEIMDALPEGRTAIALSDFVAAFHRIRDFNDWDVSAAMDRLGLSSEFKDTEME